MEKERFTVEMLAQRLKEHSVRLNAARAITEPQPSSRLPVLGPVLNLLRRLACGLATRWYVAPQIEQQARFAQEVTAAYDQLASVLVLFEHIRAEHSRELAEWKMTVSASMSPPAGSPLDLDTLFSLPDEALHAWENADLPPQEENRTGMEPAKWYDRENALVFPLLWSDPLTGWHYLFHLTVLGLALNCRPGDLVLDLAGGSGWVSEFLGRFGLRTVLLDLVEDLLHTSCLRFSLDRRLEKCPANHPVVGDALHLPFADASFDGVICMNALHHMASYETVLREIYRVLKPGGRAVFGEPGEGHARAPGSQLAMREYGVVEKNVSLPLIYVYARRAGFACMWRYPFLHPEGLELAYPEEAASTAAVLQRMVQVLPDWLRGLSLFALEKEGRSPPTSALSPLEQVRHRLVGEITLLEHHEEVPAGRGFVERVRVRNTGDVVWLAGERAYGGYVRLGVKLCGQSGRLIRDDWLRLALPRDIAPGEQVELDVPVPAPTMPGAYRLKYDLMNEGRAWFQAYGSSPAEHDLRVVPMEGPAGVPAPPAAAGDGDPVSVARERT